MTKKIGWLGERICLLCAVLFCGLICLQSGRSALGKLWFVAAAGLVCAAAVVVLALKYWRLSDRGTDLAIFALRFVLAMAVILVIGGQPVQDFDTMYRAAQDLAQGGRGYLDQIYFYNWAYQTGFVAYEALILKLFGPGQLALQVVNALCLGGIGVLVRRIAGKLMPRRAAAALSLLYALYPAPYFLAGVLTNQHLATLFFYLAFYLLVREEKLTWPVALTAGCLIALGNAARPIGIVLVLAALCWRVIRLLLSGGRDWKGELANLAGVAGGFFLLFALLSNLVIWTGLNPEGLTNNQPMWKFVLGFNQESDGCWNRSDYENYLSLPTQEADEAMREVVRERLGAGPVKLAGLAVRKSAVMWGQDEYMFWGFGHLNGARKLGPLTVDQYTQVLSRGDKGVYLLAFALALLGAAALLRRGTGGGPALLLTFLVCGYYAVHLIVEVQSRYRYFMMPAVFLLAGVGLTALLERCSRTNK